MHKGTQVSLCEAAHSQLVIVDVQQRLAAAMPAESLGRMMKRAALLLDVAAVLSIPTLCSEQAPAGLGPTVSGIAEHLPADAERVDKTCFSCAGAPAFQEGIANNGRRQVILAGMESHVCILQTAVQLAQQGLEVFVVEDAVCSRNARHHRNAMARLRQAGVIVTNTESVIFEWMRDSKHEHFRRISALLKAS